MSAAITKALHQVMSQVSYVQKTGKNTFHNYKYAGEAALLEALRPAMIEAGLILIPSVEAVSPIDEHGITTIRVEYTLAHKDGDIWPHKIVAAGAGGDKNKNGVGDKGLYKAITGANKYLLFKLFQIETGDDPEADSDHDRGGKRQNPHVTTPSDLSDAVVEYDQYGEPVDNIPLPERGIERLPKAKVRADFEIAGKAMMATQTEMELFQWARRAANLVGTFPADWDEIIRKRFAEHRDELRKGKAA
jgi:hypothetical protein